MTKHAIVLFTFISMIALARAAEVQFVPLQDYIGQSDVAKDPVALGYVAERCSALYTVFARDLEGELAPERQKFRAEAASAGEKFMGIAVQLSMRGSTIDFKHALARASKIVVQLGNLYVDRIEAARVRAGTCSRTV